MQYVIFSEQTSVEFPGALEGEGVSWVEGIKAARKELAAYRNKAVPGVRYGLIKILPVNGPVEIEKAS